MKLNTFAFSQFCDDIRFEVGNKTSLMGVYNGELVTPQLPMSLAKLCCVVTVVLPATMVPASLSARVYKEEDLLGEQTVGPEFLQKATAHFASQSVSDDGPTNLSLAFYFYFSPLNLSADCKLRAVAYIGEEEWPAGKLKIKQGELPEFGQALS